MNIFGIKKVKGVRIGDTTVRLAPILEIPTEMQLKNWQDKFLSVDNVQIF